MPIRNLTAGGSIPSGFGLKVFTKEELQTLHFATLEILWKTGIRVDSEEALEIFNSFGARVSEDKGATIVRLPRDLVENCIRWAPKTVVLHGRDPALDYVMESGRVGFSTFGECVRVIDPYTRQIRASTKNDLAWATRVCDYLDQMVVAERAMCSSDQYPQTQPLHNYEAMAQNTGKHVVLGFGTAANTRKVKEMAAACIGGSENFDSRPTVSAIVCSTSPLTLTQACCEVVIECAKLNIGMVIIPLPLSGGTSPATVAGTIAIHNAEVLSVIALSQLTAKGTASTYGSCTTTMDLRTGAASFGAPEHGIINACLTKLAQHYQLPCWVGGGLSDSKIPDCQAAYEFSLSSILCALAGANVIYGAGCLDQGLTFDFAKLVMDAEQIQRILYTIEEVDLSAETIALDVIHEVGPGGEFLSHEHTFDNMRKMSQPDLFDRRSWEAWMEFGGGKDLTNQAYERAKEIIEKHEPMELSLNSAQTMREIIYEYEKELKADQN